MVCIFQTAVNTETGDPFGEDLEEENEDETETEDQDEVQNWIWW